MQKNCLENGGTQGLLLTCCVLDFGKLSTDLIIVHMGSFKSFCLVLKKKFILMVWIRVQLSPNATTESLKVSPPSGSEVACCENTRATIVQLSTVQKGRRPGLGRREDFWEMGPTDCIWASDVAQAFWQPSWKRTCWAKSSSWRIGN